MGNFIFCSLIFVSAISGNLQASDDDDSPRPTVSKVTSIFSPLGYADFHGERLSEIEVVKISEWVSQTNPLDFTRGNEFLSERFSRSLLSHGSSPWFRKLIEFPFFMILHRFGIWFQMPEGRSNRFYFVSYTQPVSQFRDLLFLGRGDQIRELEFFWIPMAPVSEDLFDPHPPLLFDLAADRIRDSIIQSRGQMSVLEMLALEAPKNRRCISHLRSLGWPIP